MEQTRLGSLVEALINVVLSYITAIISQIILFPKFGIDVPLSANLHMGIWFALIGVVRSYAVRRWCNARLKRMSEAIASRIQSHNTNT